MRLTVLGRVIAPTVAALALLSAFQSRTPDEEFVAIIRSFFAQTAANDWESIEKLPGITWAPQQPTSLANCLPDGSCYTRQGTATVGGRKLNVIATGSRTIVANVYLRNAASPFGEAAIIRALKKAEVSLELARCPLRGRAGGTNFYRLKGDGLTTGYLSIQTSCNGRPCEGFALYHGEQLPRLTPAQLSLYSEQCQPGQEQQSIATRMPHEQLADVIASFIPSTGSVAYGWSALSERAPVIQWSSGTPTRGDLSYRGDSNPLIQSGQVTLSDRPYSVLVSGTSANPVIIYFEESGLHPRGEHLLGVLYEKGFTVQLVRCGPVYTESTNNWYRVTSGTTRPIMLEQSIRYDGNRVQDSYELRLDGSLPARDPRDRNPGVNGCR